MSAMRSDKIAPVEVNARRQSTSCSDSETSRMLPLRYPAKPLFGRMLNF
jgi:hypothetical protein